MKKNQVMSIFGSFQISAQYCGTFILNEDSGWVALELRDTDWQDFWLHRFVKIPKSR